MATMSSGKRGDAVLTVEELLRLFLNTLLIELHSSNLLHRVACIAQLGSWVKDDRTNMSDYDLLIICKESSIFPELTSTIAKVQRRLAETQGVLISGFPSFRIEEFHRELMKTPSCLVHLLIFPSSKAFLQWEPAYIVRSICRGARVIYGDADYFSSVAKMMIEVDANEAMEFLLSVFFNSFTYVQCGIGVPDGTRIRESFHKLQYVVRHATALVLEFAFGISADSWKQVSSTHHKLGLSSSSVVDRIYETRLMQDATGNICLGVEEMVALYKRANEYLLELTALAGPILQPKKVRAC